MSTNMYVIKRNGEKEDISFDKVLRRIKYLCEGLKHVEPVLISQKVIQGIYAGIETTQLDELAAQVAAFHATKHPDYSILAARISVSNLQKQTMNTFSELAEKFYHYKHPDTDECAPLISKETYDIVMKYKDIIDNAIHNERDFDFDYFGFKTLEKSYLLKMNGKIAERPQFLFMRVAIGIHGGDDIHKIIETYDLMSQRYFTHATPTLFNAGTNLPQMSSCFLLTMKADSIEGIYDTLKSCAVISKYAGGIGLAVHDIRASKSYIRGTNGTSNGIVPMLRVFNNTARYVDQGGGKRKGSIAIYLEPWHADIYQFLELKKNHGNESDRARDLFYSLWIPDLFMERVKNNDTWSLMCPNECPGLSDCYGTEFETLYTSYERQGKVRDTINAQQLWFTILDSQIETGTPYMVYKDQCNRKSNQQNLGTIKCSNLCTEIVEYTSSTETAVCNLASINLSKFVITNVVHHDDDNNKVVVGKEEVKEEVKDGNNTNDNNDNINNTIHFDFQKLYEVTMVVAKNLNKIIDRNFYPIPEAMNSNMRHRPIGIGVQGLADVFQLLQIPFESSEAKKLNRDIFETIYFAACTASCELAKIHGPYSTYEGSPASLGNLQFDLWNVEPTNERWDWPNLKEDIRKHGMRNSLLVAPMPTASTAQILGNNESTEPFTSNIYNRRVLAGEFTVVNKHLLRHLTAKGLWTDSIRSRIIADNGSVQNISEIPIKIREIYKTVWEIPQRCVIDMAIDRAPYICQSQSLNIHIAQPNSKKLTSMHFYAWSHGLKTGMYYLRSRPKADAIKFTVVQEQIEAEDMNKKATSSSPTSPTASLSTASSSSSSSSSASSSPTTAAAAAGTSSSLAGGGGGGARDIVPARVMVCSRDDPEGCLSCGA